MTMTETATVLPVTTRRPCVVTGPAKKNPNTLNPTEQAFLFYALRHRTKEGYFCEKPAASAIEMNSSAATVVRTFHALVQKGACEVVETGRQDKNGYPLPTIYRPLVPPDWVVYLDPISPVESAPISPVKQANPISPVKRAPISEPISPVESAKSNETSPVPNGMIEPSTISRELVIYPSAIGIKDSVDSLAIGLTVNSDTVQHTDIPIQHTDNSGREIGSPNSTPAVNRPAGNGRNIGGKVDEVDRVAVVQFMHDQAYPGTVWNAELDLDRRQRLKTWAHKLMYEGVTLEEIVTTAQAVKKERERKLKEGDVTEVRPGTIPQEVTERLGVLKPTEENRRRWRERYDAGLTTTLCPECGWSGPMERNPIMKTWLSCPQRCSHGAFEKYFDPKWPAAERQTYETEQEILHQQRIVEDMARAKRQEQEKTLRRILPQIAVRLFPLHPSGESAEDEVAMEATGYLADDFTWTSQQLLDVRNTFMNLREVQQKVLAFATLEMSDHNIIEEVVMDHSIVKELKCGIVRSADPEPLPEKALRFYVSTIQDLQVLLADLDNRLPEYDAGLMLGHDGRWILTCQSPQFSPWSQSIEYEAGMNLAWVEESFVLEGQ
jgi:hypothetical protein